MKTPPPTGLMAVAGDAQVTLSWNVVNGTTYTLYWSTTQGAGVSGTQAPNATTSPYTHRGLMNNTTYYYVLTATNSFGVSLPSSEQPATPVRITPQPTGLTATASIAGVAQVTLSWHVANGTTYTLYWSTTQGAGVSGTQETNATSPYTHRGLMNNTAYYYVLTAEEMNSVISPPSSETSATPTQTVAIWTSGVRGGNFGYNACQAALVATASNSIGAKLRSLGYTKAVFLGSTNAYNFKDIVSDGDALNLPGGTSHLLRLFRLNSNVALEVTNTDMRTIGNVLHPIRLNGKIAGILVKIGIPSTVNSVWWTFTQSNGVQDSSNCSGANSNVTSVTGRTGSTSDASTVTSPCNTTLHVVCVAK